MNRVSSYHDECKYETVNSTLYGDTGSTDNNVWIPKKLVDSGDIEIRKLSNGYELIMPHWFAERNGLV
jgi:hypothetical protein